MYINTLRILLKKIIYFLFFHLNMVSACLSSLCTQGHGPHFTRQIRHHTLCYGSKVSRAKIFKFSHIKKIKDQQTWSSQRNVTASRWAVVYFFSFALHNRTASSHSTQKRDLWNFCESICIKSSKTHASFYGKLIEEIIDRSAWIRCIFAVRVRL